MLKIFKPPFRIGSGKRTLKIFLAGSIEMGTADDWQSKATKALEKILNRDIEVFNPRRDEWDATWRQDYESPEFSQQVNWELNAMKKADKIILHFEPNTLSPISLLELGLYATSGKLIVSCPKDFYRSGNVHIVCDRFNIPLYENIDDLLNGIIIQNNLIL